MSENSAACPPVGVPGGNQPEFNSVDPQNMLLRAILAKDVPSVSYLLKNGASANIPYQTGYFPLHVAAGSQVGDPFICSILVQAGANPNQTDSTGSTPLHHAAFNKSPDALDFLLRSGARVNITRNDGMTPLHLACGVGDSIACASRLLAAGADTDVRSLEHKSTPLTEAILYARVHIVVLLYHLGIPNSPGYDDLAPETFLDNLIAQAPLEQKQAFVTVKCCIPGAQPQSSKPVKMALSAALSTGELDQLRHAIINDPYEAQDVLGKALTKKRLREACMMLACGAVIPALDATKRSFLPTPKGECLGLIASASTWQLMRHVVITQDYNALEDILNFTHVSCASYATPAEMFTPDAGNMTPLHYAALLDLKHPMTMMLDSNMAVLDADQLKHLLSISGPRVKEEIKSYMALRSQVDDYAHKVLMQSLRPDERFPLPLPGSGPFETSRTGHFYSLGTILGLRHVSFVPYQSMGTIATANQLWNSDEASALTVLRSCILRCPRTACQLMQDAIRHGDVLTFARLHYCGVMALGKKAGSEIRAMLNQMGPFHPCNYLISYQNEVLNTQSLWAAMHWSPVFFAIVTDEIKRLQAEFSLSPLLQERDTFGRTPLHVAGALQKDSIIEFLLTMGVYNNDRDNAGETPAQRTPLLSKSRKLLKNPRYAAMKPLTGIRFPIFAEPPSPYNPGQSLLIPTTYSPQDFISKCGHSDKSLRRAPLMIFSGFSLSSAAGSAGQARPPPATPDKFFVGECLGVRLNQASPELREIAASIEPDEAYEIVTTFRGLCITNPRRARELIEGQSGFGMLIALLFKKLQQFK